MLRVLLALAGIFAGVFFFARKSEAATVSEDVFEKTANARLVDADLLRAVAYVESSLNSDAVRWNPPDDVSVGFMQILCTPPAGTKKGEDYVCQNRLDFADQWPQTFESLRDPETNLDIGAQILAWNQRNYGFWRGVAMYNNYAARFAGVNGPFPNDSYVNRVKARYLQLKQEKQNA